MNYSEAFGLYNKSKKILDQLLGDIAIFWEGIADVKAYYSYGYGYIYIEIEDIPLSSDDISYFETTFGLELCCTERSNYVYMKEDRYKCTRRYIFEGV